MCAQPSAILYLSVMDLIMTNWLVETCCLFDTSICNKRILLCWRIIFYILIRRVRQYIWKHCVMYVILSHRKWCHVSTVISNVQDTPKIVIDLFVFFAFVSSVFYWHHSRWLEDLCFVWPAEMSQWPNYNPRVIFESYKPVCWDM